MAVEPKHYSNVQCALLQGKSVNVVFTSKQAALSSGYSLGATKRLIVFPPSSMANWCVDNVIPVPTAPRAPPVGHKLQLIWREDEQVHIQEVFVGRVRSEREFQVSIPLASPDRLNGLCGVMLWDGYSIAGVTVYPHREGRWPSLWAEIPGAAMRLGEEIASYTPRAITSTEK